MKQTIYRRGKRWTEEVPDGSVSTTRATPKTVERAVSQTRSRTGRTTRRSSRAKDTQ